MFEREGYGDDCKKIESMWRAGEREQALNAIPEPLIRDRVLIGSADEISSRLSEYVSEGLDTALTLPVPIPDRDYVTDTLRTIEVLSKNPPGDQSG